MTVPKETAVESGGDMTVPKKKTAVENGVGLIWIALSLVKIGFGAAALANNSCQGEPMIPIWLVGEQCNIITP